MIDTRALTWTALFPADAGYMWGDVPEPFRELLELAGLRDGKDVLCLWSPDVDDFRRADIDRFGALALVNARRIPLTALREAGFTYVRRYAVAPRLADARWFVPQENIAIAAAVLGAYVPYRASARLKKTAARLALRLRLPWWYGDELVIAARMVPPLERVLAKPFHGDEVRLAFSTGTPGPSRKPVAHIVSTNGQILGYAKLGVTEASARLVRREGELLRSLAADARSTKHTPRLLFQGEIDGMPAILVSPLAGHPGPRKSTAAHDQFLVSLRSEHRRPVTASALFRNLQQRIQVLGGRLPKSARQDLEGLRPILEELMLPSTIMHGDFAPWNVRIEGDHLCAFDWESGEMDAVPLMDELHHALQVGFLLHNWSVPQAFAHMRAVQKDNSLGLPASQATAIEVLYLLDAFSRRLEEGHSPGERLNQRYSALLSLHTDVRALERISH